MYRAYPKKPVEKKLRPDPKITLIQRVAKVKELVESEPGITDTQIKLICNFGPATFYQVYKAVLETSQGYSRAKGKLYCSKPVQIEEIQ